MQEFSIFSKFLPIPFLVILGQYYFFTRIALIYKSFFGSISRKQKSWFFLVVLLLHTYVIHKSIQIIIRITGFSEIPGTSENLIYVFLVIIPFWIYFIIMANSVIYFLLIDLYRIVKSKISKSGAVSQRAYSFLFLIILCFFAVYVPARIIYDHYSIKVTNVTLSKKNLPEDLNGLKIAFITDIQVDRFTMGERLSNYIDKVNSLKPDLVLNGGDFVTGGRVYWDTVLKEMGRINAPYGIYSCIGDHDRSIPPRKLPDYILNKTKELGVNPIHVFENSGRDIKIGNTSLDVTIIMYTYSGKVNTAELNELIKPNPGSVYRIFLSHQPNPDLITKASKNGYDLFLAGHTHGGQVVALFPFINLTGSIVESPYVEGTYYHNGMPVIICNGLGYSIAPIRYNAEPEIVLITLTNKEV